MIQEIANDIDVLATACQTTFDVHERLCEMAKTKSSSDLEALSFALGYMRSRSGDADESTFEPMMRFDDRVYPPPLEAIGLQITDSWIDWAKQLVHPLLVARLNHLLWEKRIKPANEYACRAVDAYLDLPLMVDDFDVERSHDLGSALDLAHRIRDGLRREAVINQLRTWIQVLLASDEGSAGALLVALGYIAALQPTERPQDLDKMLTLAESRLNDPHLREALLDIRIALAQNRQQKQRWAAESIADWLDAASQVTSGILKAVYLKKAVDRARTFELPELRDQALRELLQAGIGEEVQEISASVTIKREDYERWIQGFLAGASAAQCLRLFAEYCPVSLSSERVESIVTEQMVQNPLQYLVTKIVTDSHGLQIETVSNREGHFRVALAQHDTMAITFWGLHAADVLDRITSLWAIDEAALTETCEGSFITPYALPAILKSLEHYQRGDYESCVTVVLPRIEECLRAVALNLGLSVTEINRSGGVQWRALRGLITDISREAPDRFMRYLDLLLADPLGPNLRNRALHGLIDKYEKSDAALALHAALWISTIRRRPTSD